jgi:two-component system nitrogen regulation response regulator GlnG
VVSRVLAQYAWPRNVAELKRVLEQAAAVAKSDELQLGDLPGELLNSVGPSLLEGSSTVLDRRAATNVDPANLAALSRGLFEWARNDPHYRIIPAMERELIIHAMAETGGNQVQASKLLGITRATLRKRLKRLNIQREVFIY